MTEQTSSPAEIQRKLDQTVDPYNSACGCMGPQRDEPVCPCAMQSVIKWRGRWIQLKVIGNDDPGKGFLDGVVPSADPLSPEAYAPEGYNIDDCSVMLTGYGTSKLAVIRAIREITALGIADAKKMVDKSDHAPVEIVSGQTRWDAYAVKHKIEKAGGTVKFA
jgi:large subunit ribosomal protein L7/L12